MSASKTSTYAGVGTAQLSEPDDVDGYLVHGVAIGADDVTVGQSGTKKLWPGDELEAAAATLEGTDLVRDHINNTKGKIGTVRHAEYIADLGVIYEAEIAPHYEELANDIKAGLMEVSVRAYHRPEPELERDEETDALIVEDVHFDNLSVVNDGASPSNTADIGSIQEFDADADGGQTAAASATIPEHGTVATLERSAPIEDATFGDDESLSVTVEDTPSEGDAFSPDDQSVFERREAAERKGSEMGCGENAHQITLGGESYYVPCSSPGEYRKIASDEEASACSIDDTTVEALSSIEGTYTADGTVFAISPDEHNDDSTEHADDAKYPLTSCTGENSVDVAWNLRGHGNYTIDQSTLENRIINAAEQMDCDAGVVGMDEFSYPNVDLDDSDVDELDGEMYQPNDGDMVKWRVEPSMWGRVVHVDTDAHHAMVSIMTMEAGEAVETGYTVTAGYEDIVPKDRDSMGGSSDGVADEESLGHYGMVGEYDLTDGETMVSHQRSDGESVTIDRVEWPHFDFVVRVYEFHPDVGDYSEMLGYRELPAGTHEDVSVECREMIPDGRHELQVHLHEQSEVDSKGGNGIGPHSQDENPTVANFTVAVGEAELMVVEHASDNSFSDGDWVRWDSQSPDGEIGRISGAYEEGDELPDIRGSNTFKPEGDDVLYTIELFKEEDGMYHPVSGDPVAHYHDSVQGTAAPESMSEEPIELSNSTTAEMVMKNYDSKDEMMEDLGPDHDDVYADEADAESRADDLGIEGTHTHEFDGETYYMPGSDHDAYMEAINEADYHNGDDDSEMGGHDGEECSSPSPFARSVPVATGIASTGTNPEPTDSTTHMIDYEPADIDELSDELDDPVVVEQSELESLADEAETGEEVQSELEELSEKIDREESAAETLSALDAEERDRLEGEENVTVVEASAAEMFDEVTQIYAEELSEYSLLDADELGEKFSPTELKTKLDEHDEAELSAQIDDVEPEPDGGHAGEEELSEDGEGDEAELREKYAAELEDKGWERQAEKVRAGEIDITA